jgi:lipopolysaccharide transport system permease protein
VTQADAATLAPANLASSTPADSPPASAAAPEPTIRIRPPKRWQPIDFAEIWAFRDLLWAFAIRDVKLRYKQTVMGVAWVVLQPLIGAAIFTFIFGVLANLETDGLPAFVVSFIGMLAWTAFSGTLGKVSGCLTGNQALVAKVYFPRLILPLAQVLSTLVDLAVSLLVAVVLLIIYREHLGDVGWRILTFPVWMTLLFMLAVGVGNWTGALMVSYRDVRYIQPVVIQFLMYASPVGYMLIAIQDHDRIPEWAVGLYLLNPLASLIEATRWSLLGQTENSYVPWGYVAYASGVAVLTFIIGAFVFRSMERKFADVI